MKNMRYRSFNFQVWTRFLFSVAVFCILLGLLSGSVFSGLASAEEAKAKKWPHEESDLLPDPDIIFRKLPNGFRYVLMPNKTPINRVSMHLTVNAGSLNEEDDEQGFAHFLEHLLFCGTTNFRPGELVRYFQSIGMDFGADANARTRFSDTVYDILLPVGSRESVADGLKVLRDFADGALLLPEEVDRERKVVLAEKLTRDSSSYRTFVTSLKFSLPDSLISSRLPIGDENVLKKADHNDLRRFYDAWYRPENMVLVVVGDVDPDMASTLIEDAFKTLSSRGEKKPAPDIGKINHKGIKAFYHHEPESGTASVSIGTIFKGKDIADSSMYQKTTLKTKLSDKILQNRIDTLIRKPGTPFTSANIRSGRFLREILYTGISAESTPENWKESLAIIEQELRAALLYGFSESEVKRAIDDFLAALDDQEKKSPTRNSQAVANQIIEAISDNKVMLSPAQRKELLGSFLQTLTASDIHENLKSLWSYDHRLIELTGNVRLSASDGLLPEAQILSAWNKSLDIEVSPPVEYKPVEFPYLPVPVSSGQVYQRREISDLGIIQVDFENGVRLNLKKTDFKKNQVIASLVLGAGSASEPPDKPGLSHLTAEVVRESGFGSLTREELDRALAGKKTGIAFSINEDRFLFKATSVPGEIELMFQLLYSQIEDPGFRENAYVLGIERFNQQHSELSKTVDGVAKLHVRRFLAGGDSRFGFPSEKEINILKLDDIKAWLLPSLLQSAIEISIVGDMDIDETIGLAARYFGSLPGKSSAFLNESSTLPKFPDGTPLTLEVDTEIPKTLVLVAYPTDDFWDISRTRRLSVLGEVFSDRLREAVRERLGAAYSQAAFNHPSRAYPGYGVFQAMITVDIKDAEKVINEVRSIADSLSEKLVSSDELRRSLDPILTGIKDAVRTNDYWLNSVLTGSSRRPQQIEWSRRFQKDYESVSPEEILALAKKYLDNSKAAVIIIKPKK